MIANKEKKEDSQLHPNSPCFHFIFRIQQEEKKKTSINIYKVVKDKEWIIPVVYILLAKLTILSAKWSHYI